MLDALLPYTVQCSICGMPSVRAGSEMRDVDHVKGCFQRRSQTRKPARSEQERFQAKLNSLSRHSSFERMVSQLLCCICIARLLLPNGVGSAKGETGTFLTMLPPPCPSPACLACPPPLCPCSPFRPLTRADVSSCCWPPPQNICAPALSPRLSRRLLPVQTVKWPAYAVIGQLQYITAS